MLKMFHLPGGKRQLVGEIGIGIVGLQRFAYKAAATAMHHLFYL